MDPAVIRFVKRFDTFVPASYSRPSSDAKKWGYIYFTVAVRPTDGAKFYYLGQSARPDFNPDYKGSGMRILRFCRKYGKQCARVYGVIWASSDRQLNRFEEHGVTVCKTLFGDRCLNIREGGGSRGRIAEETKLKIGLANKGKPSHNKGQTWPASRALERVMAAEKIARKAAAVEVRRQEREEQRLARQQQQRQLLQAKEQERSRAEENKRTRAEAWIAGAESRRLAGNAKRSASLLGHSVSSRARQRIGNAHRGKPGHCLNRGKVRSEETKAKLRAAWGRRRATHQLNSEMS